MAKDARCPFQAKQDSFLPGRDGPYWSDRAL